MVAEAELRAAAEIMFRTILDDDSLWDALLEGDKKQLVDGMVQEIPNMVPDEQRMQLRAIVALAIHHSKQEGAAS